MVAPPKVMKYRDKNVTIIDVDWSMGLALTLPKILDSAVGRAARDVKIKMNETFHSQADGSWPANAPGTIKWKGHDTPMRGRTYTLHDPLNVEIRDAKTEPEAKLRGRLVGWWDTPHPDSKLTHAGLALVHEEPEAARAAGVPPRPTIRPTFNKHGSRILRDWAFDVLAQIDLHGAPSMAAMRQFTGVVR